MGDFEDALTQLREQGVSDELLERLESFSGSKLMRRAEAADAARESIAALTAEIEQRKNSMKISEALTKAGVDYDSLRPAEVQAISALEFEGDEPSEDWAANMVAQLGLPMRRSGA